MAELSSLPRFARDLLASCPSAGAGVHNWLFRAARVLHPFFGDKRELALALENASANCGRSVPEQEIVDAILNSAPCAWQPGEKPTLSVRRTPAWPSYQRELAHDVVEEVSARQYPRGRQSFDRASLVIESPVGWPDHFPAAAILRMLHSRCAALPADLARGAMQRTMEAMLEDSSDPLLCAGVSTYDFGTCA